jgi:hypothetical protein
MRRRKGKTVIETRLRYICPGIKPGRDLFTVRAVAGVEVARAVSRLL